VEATSQKTESNASRGISPDQFPSWLTVRASVLLDPEHSDWRVCQQVGEIGENEPFVQPLNGRRCQDRSRLLDGGRFMTAIGKPLATVTTTQSSSPASGNRLRLQLERHGRKIGNIESESE
jgi:hypothetical protein